LVGGGKNGGLGGPKKRVGEVSKWTGRVWIFGQKRPGVGGKRGD